jgi:hypothetical protein
MKYFCVMKWIAILSVVLLFSACRQNKNNPSASLSKDTAAVLFFPVTSYLKGEINNIRTGASNPIYRISRNNHTDSSFIKMDSLEQVMAPFLYPEIDSVHLARYFTGTAFLDQTLGSFTFTYDPVSALPDSIDIHHWDVYVDPEKNTVTRIYIVKQIPGGEKQLTWKAGESCKIVTIDKPANGNETIRSEETLTWKY